MALRFGYTLMRVRPEDTGTDYETLATKELRVESDDELRESTFGLRDWAVDRLRELHPELALFYAVFSTFDEDDVPGWPFRTMHIAWEGQNAVALAR